MKVNYDDCLKFAKKVCNLKLTPTQKGILRCFCDGKTALAYRGSGRSTVARIFGAYVANLLDKNDYSEPADEKFPVCFAERDGLVPKERIQEVKTSMTDEAWDREYLLKTDNVKTTKEMLPLETVQKELKTLRNWTKEAILDTDMSRHIQEAVDVCMAKLNMAAERSGEIKYKKVCEYSEADECYIAKVPSLPGCYAFGETELEALKDADKAIQEWLDFAGELGNEAPEEE